MNDKLLDIESFNNKYGLNEDSNKKPGFISEDFMKFRLVFLLEELDELANACGFVRTGNQFHFVEEGSRNLGNALDALVDLEYVLLGTVNFMGMSNIFDEAWDRVHSSNMLKERVEKADQSKRGSKYDVKKPWGWRAPTFDDLLK